MINLFCIDVIKMLLDELLRLKKKQSKLSDVCVKNIKELNNHKDDYAYLNSKLDDFIFWHTSANLFSYHDDEDIYIDGKSPDMGFIIKKGESDCEYKIVHRFNLYDDMSKDLYPVQVINRFDLLTVLALWDVVD